MKHFALIGEKLGHSLSAPIHLEAYRLMNADADYRLIEVAQEKIGGLRALIDRENLSGVNVTIPYKQRVLPLIDEVTPAADAIGAVNTIVVRDGKLIGDNTDAFGFAAMLDYYGIAVKGGRFAVLGATGGAARAVVHALVTGGAAVVYLVSRSPLGRATPGRGCAWVSYRDLMELDYDVMVNCTPRGMAPDEDGLPAEPVLIARAGEALVDLVYNPPVTGFLRVGQRMGRKAVNGLYMLVAQAIKADSLWLGADAGLIGRIFPRMEGRA